MNAPAAQAGQSHWRRWNGGAVRPDVNRLLGKGGEANVCALSGEAGLVAKLYHRPGVARRERIADMLLSTPVASGAPDGHVSLAWPVDGIDTPQGDFAGFLMPRLASRITIGALLVPGRRREEWPDVTWAHLVRIARNVSHVADAIHAAGHVIGDINDGNILVTRQALISWVDCDSFQIARTGRTGVHFCQVGVPEFLAPELQGVDLARTVRTVEQDRFSLALLLFRLLMEGQHPFSGLWRGAGDPPSPPEAISRGFYAFAHLPGGLRPAKIAPPLENLPPHIRELFHAAFLRGISRPEARPSAAEWCEAFTEMEGALLQCETGPRHRYSSHLDACPWCERKRLFRGLDAFPAPGWIAPAELAPPAKVPQQPVHGRIQLRQPGPGSVRNRQNPARGAAGGVRQPRRVVTPVAAHAAISAALGQLAQIARPASLRPSGTGRGSAQAAGKAGTGKGGGSVSGGIQRWRTTLIMALCLLGILGVLHIAWLQSQRRKAASDTLLPEASARSNLSNPVEPEVEPEPEPPGGFAGSGPAVPPLTPVQPVVAANLQPAPVAAAAPAPVPDPLQCPWDQALRLGGASGQVLQHAGTDRAIPLGDWAMEFAAASLDAATVGTPVSVAFAGWSAPRRGLVWRIEIAPPAEKVLRVPWYALYRPAEKSWSALSPRQRHSLDWKAWSHTPEALNLGLRTEPVEAFLRLLEQINTQDHAALTEGYALRSGSARQAADGWTEMRRKWPLLRVDPVSSLIISRPDRNTWRASARVRIAGESSDSSAWQERIEAWNLEIIREAGRLRISEHTRSVALELSDGNGNALPGIVADAEGRPSR